MADDENGREPPPNELGELFASILGDKEVVDVELKGTDDDITVTALKSVLAAWSCVFRRMFFGSFAEATLRVINTSFERKVVDWLVEFCYKSHISFLESNMDLKDTEKKTVTEKVVLRVLSLSEAADYYQISQLGQYIDKWLLASMKKNPWISCFVYETTDTDNRQNGLAFQFMKDNLESAQMGEAELRYLSPASMKILVEYPSVCTTELFLFECIHKWAKLDLVDDKHKETTIKDNEEGTTIPRKRIKSQHQPSHMRSRWEDANNLAKSIELTRIQPKSLCSIVKHSGLVSRDDLFLAYESHMLNWEKLNCNFISDFCKIPRSRFQFEGGFQVTVQGSGVPGANGVYRAREVFNDVPEYHKTGLWHAEALPENRTFCVFWDTLRWNIAVLDREDVLDDDSLLYRSMEHSRNKVPSSGWEVEDPEFLPVPTLILE